VQFGFSAAQAQADGLTISSGVTSIFWVYVVFVIAMAISCAWLATAPNGAAGNPLPAYPGPAYRRLSGRVLSGPVLSRGSRDGRFQRAG
jgi:hypothetical protein